MPLLKTMQESGARCSNCGHITRSGVWVRTPARTRWECSSCAGEAEIREGELCGLPSDVVEEVR